MDPLITVMGVKRKNDYGEVQGPTIISDPLSSQILHYADAHEKASDNDVVNAGIYYISTKIYDEFEGAPNISIEEEKLFDDGEGVGGTNNFVIDTVDFDIEMTNLEEDYCLLPSPEKAARHRSFMSASRKESSTNLTQIATLRSSTSATTAAAAAQNLTNAAQHEDLRFKRFEQDFRYVNEM